MADSQKEFGYKMETKATDAQVAHREKLYDLFRNRPMPDDQLMICLGLFMRSSALTKVLFVNELYELILDKPGVIMEFGTWWGQNLALFENLRAIYEPFNASRRVIGFDTYEGYPNVSDQDRRSETITEGGYKVSEGYQSYLNQLLAYHEENNILGNIRKTETVKGDVSKTAKTYFENNPETIVALAYFDMALYEPSKAAFEAIKPHLISGSVLMLDEFNSKDYPGETLAFKEVLSDIKFEFRKSRYMTDRTILIVQ
ncbi:MAG: crotonobetainyl-CoA--carnitine CoA-transferase [Thalassospira sp.]|uniref:crotonobetainyl-CoA--carnitine CoA-transferase n=1 Tax=Thalassospira sp. TaxID=1912094 RepID=UPI0032F068AC